MLPPVAAEVEARLPPELRRLATLAFDWWWTWQPDGPSLFRDIDPSRAASRGENPIRMLGEAPLARLADLARSPAFLARVDGLSAAHHAHHERPFVAIDGVAPERPLAFLCAEYAIHASLPIYAGGLGVLAGDLLKEAADRALPMIGVGLLYRRGYFHQRLDPSGWQHESAASLVPEHLPLVEVLDDAGTPLRIRLPVRGSVVAMRAWRTQVGKVPLYLLDTDVEENDPVARWATAQLYASDPELRLLQYAVLGMGSIRLLRVLGVTPAVFHLNEGHAALATIELLGSGLRSGLSFDDALAACRAKTVFTTHTPVAAGNERYPAWYALRVLRDAAADAGVDEGTLLRLARAPAATDFGMTELALRTSRRTNGVSRRHAEVARTMWRVMWPERPVDRVPIEHVTNGVHLPTWMPRAMQELLARWLGADFASGDPTVWERIDTIPDEELWRVRGELRRALVELVRTRSVEDRLARGEPLGYVEAAARAFDSDTLTVGFARRIATYKRLHLIVHDAARALRLLHGPRPIQVVIAGKAHPRDDGAKRIVQTIFGLKDAVDGRVAFLEDYDMAIAQAVIAGCDVWVNLPRPPLEASGTSGMKAALAGGINLSVDDGWWAEAATDANGFTIHSEPGPDDAVQDRNDANALYGLLEREIVPAFHERDDRGIPRRWLARVRASLRTAALGFTASRALADYLARAYAPSPPDPPTG